MPFAKEKELQDEEEDEEQLLFGIHIIYENFRAEDEAVSGCTYSETFHITGHEVEVFIVVGVVVLEQRLAFLEV